MNRVKLFFAGVVVPVVLLGSVGTWAQSGRGTFTDSRDGKTYRYVTIGNQTWMAENLNYATSSGSWCYDNNTANCNRFGRLYDWNTARSACPVGWRLPSHNEWDILVNFVGGESIAGTRLKSSTGWEPWAGNVPVGTNEFGFSALPGGSRNWGSFTDVGYIGDWWTSTEGSMAEVMLGGEATAQSRGIWYDNEDVRSDWNNKVNGISVRCIRN